MPVNPGPRYATVTKAARAAVLIQKNAVLVAFVLGQAVTVVVTGILLLVVQALS